MRTLKGAVTIFLALLLGLMLIFAGGLLESATIAIAKSYARGDADLAIESIFAEYHQTLFQEFHILSIEATYESGTYSVENLKDRLEFYGVVDMEWEVVGLQLLTDEQGAAFEEQIITYMKQAYGVTYLEELLGTSQDGESQRVEGTAVEAENQVAEETLNSQVEELQETLEEEETLETDWLDQLDFLTASPILSLVLPEGSVVSQGSVNQGELPSGRNLESGVSSYQLEDDVMSSVIVSEYVLAHFTNAYDCLSLDATETEASEVEGLQYEVEYILGGEDTDEENLTRVVNEILLLRLGANYTCLSQSVTKKAEVKALALAITTAAGYPLLAEALEQVLLIGWAYGESIMDVRSLMSGKSIPLLKSEADWQLSLTGLLELEETIESQSGEDVEGGLGYEEYLRILLYLEDKDDKLLRSLDMIEERLQNSHGLTYFQVDYCVTQLEYISTNTVSGGFTYGFPVSFTYR